MTDPFTLTQGLSLAMGAGSMLMGFLGGRDQERRADKIAQQQHEAALQAWEFQWEQANDAYTFALDDRDIALWNLHTKRAYENESAMQTWLDEDKVRIFDYANQIEAYNSSIETYDKQLRFNNIAAAMAANSRQRSYQDQLNLIGFQHEDMLLTDEQLKLKTEVERARADVQYVETIDKIEREETAIQQQTEEIRARSGEGGLDIQKLIQEEQQRIDEVSITKKDIDERVRTAGKMLGPDGIRSASVKEKRRAAKREAALDRSNVRNVLKDKLAQMTGKEEEARLEGSIARGKARNLGQTGRSARRNVVAAYQREGLVRSAIADAKNRSILQFNTDLERVEEKLTTQLGELNIEDSKIAEEYLHTTKSLAIQKQQAETSATHATENRLLGEKFSADTLKQALQREQDVLGYFEKEKMHTWNRRLLQLTALTNEEYIAEERLSSQEHQLYKTLESHGDQFDIDYIKLSLDKYQQDLAARSRIAATPILAPEKSKPVQVAMPELATPKKPVKGPRPVKYAGAVSGAGMAGLSSGLASLAAATASIGD